MVKKSKICTPPHKVWKILDAAEKRKSESTYSSALMKSAEYGRGDAGAIVPLCFNSVTEFPIIIKLGRRPLDSGGNRFLSEEQVGQKCAGRVVYICF